MDSIGKNNGIVTQVKQSRGSRSKHKDVSENLNPNVSPGPSNSPVIKSAKSLKSTSKNPKPLVFSPRNKIRERKFVVAKKNLKKDALAPKVACKCNEKVNGGNSKKCLCLAYEKLRASQEEFFKNGGSEGEGSHQESINLKDCVKAEVELEIEIEKNLGVQDIKIEDGYEGKKDEGIDSAKNKPNDRETGEIDSENQMGSSTVKRRRDKLIEETRKSVPECGRVMHLVKAFENLLSVQISKVSDDQEQKEIDNNNSIKLALPGLQPPPKVYETQVSSSSFCPSDLFLTSESLGLNPQASVSSSWDGSLGSVSSRTSYGGRSSRRNSSESSGTMGGRRWKKRQLKVTSLKPFKLRTEQRGKAKEEEFTKKLQEMVMEEERQRIPIAQGLPWTTEEPECLDKPPVKESTRPIDLTLRSDMRAVERAEFDQQVAEKMRLLEQYKMERERQQKLAEEEETRRVRKVLVPKAQPMPYFDRPFIPMRSSKHPTIPRETKLYVTQNKKMKCCLLWNDISSYSYQHEV